MEASFNEAANFSARADPLNPCFLPNPISSKSLSGNPALIQVSLK